MILAHFIGEQLGLAALVVMLDSEVSRFCKVGGWRSASARSFVFAAGVFFTMSEPMPIMSGVYVDARHVLVGLASFLLGPIGTLASAGTGIACRILAGGEGALSGIIGLVSTATVGLLLRVYFSHQATEFRVRHILLLGVLMNVSSATAFMLPFDAAIYLLKTGGLIVFASNVLGCSLVGSLLVREQRRIRAELVDFMASRTDSLTGLANRRVFTATLDGHFTAARSKRLSLAVMMIDIDRFKVINDTFGHIAGDRVLCAFSDVLRACGRPGDLLARLGGDEFAVVLPLTSLAEASRIAERIRKDVDDAARKGIVSYSVSVGIASTEQPHVHETNLVEAADAALYAAKHRERDASSLSLHAA